MLAALNLVFFIAGFFRNGITPVKVAPTTPANIEQAGALVPNSALVTALAAISTNAAPAFLNFTTTIVPQSLAAQTYPGSSMVGGIIQRYGPAGTTVDCTDTATNIVNAIPGAVPLQTFPLFLANMGSSALTMAGNTGVTIAGTNVIGGFSVRLFLGQVTGSGAVTMTGLFSLALQSGL